MDQRYELMRNCTKNSDFGSSLLGPFPCIYIDTRHTIVGYWVVTVHSVCCHQFFIFANGDESPDVSMLHGSQSKLLLLLLRLPSKVEAHASGNDIAISTYFPVVTIFTCEQLNGHHRTDESK